LDLVRWGLPGLPALVRGSPEVQALAVTEVSSQGRPPLVERTRRATRLYDRAGDGFFRLVDRDRRGRILVAFVEPEEG
jgi:hypothetical protein